MPIGNPTSGLSLGTVAPRWLAPPERLKTHGNGSGVGHEDPEECNGGDSFSVDIMHSFSVGPRPTRGAPCQQMLGDWACHVVLILLVVPYSGLNGFNKKLFGVGWRFVDFVHSTLQ